VVVQSRCDPRPVNAAAQCRQSGQHRQVGLASTIVLDALAARDGEPRSRVARQIAERGVDQRRLANPGLAGDESDLPPAAGCRAQPVGDLTALARATSLWWP
jgi:hypothetical protein